jgi:uncharacterized protein (DUF1501 family)
MSTTMDRRNALLHALRAGSVLAAPWAGAWAQTAPAGGPSNPLTGDNERILVVLELSGANDGLNTVVPYTDDAYYRARPRLAIRAEGGGNAAARKLDERFALNPGMVGFQRLWKDGQLAIFHGCGYENPSFSHFTSMAYWHTGVPHRGDAYGWVGRLADELAPNAQPNFLVNVETEQSLAVRSRVHTPVVFDEPENFRRIGTREANALAEQIAADSAPSTIAPGATGNRAYLEAVTRSAVQASALVRKAWLDYKSPVDYGLVPVQMPKIAACIAARLPARLYYTAFRNNAFDTHVQQADLHQRLLTYASDAVHAFLRDMDRIGMGDKVAVLVFSEFGRRVAENANLGTDHGTANVMFMAGKRIRGGHYGTPPSLTDLIDGENLRHTTDFRRVYATAIEGWLKVPVAQKVLKGSFEGFAVA